jgi:hypothetical protein
MNPLARIAASPVASVLTAAGVGMAGYGVYRLLGPDGWRHPQLPVEGDGSIKVDRLVDYYFDQYNHDRDRFIELAPQISGGEPVSGGENAAIKFMTGIDGQWTTMESVNGSKDERVRESGINRQRTILEVLLKARKEGTTAVTREQLAKTISAYEHGTPDGRLDTNEQIAFNRAFGFDNFETLPFDAYRMVDELRYTTHEPPRATAKEIMDDFDHNEDGTIDLTPVIADNDKLLASVELDDTYDNPPAIVKQLRDGAKVFDPDSDERIRHEYGYVMKQFGTSAALRNFETLAPLIDHLKKQGPLPKSLTLTDVERAVAEMLDTNGNGFITSVDDQSLSVIGFGNLIEASAELA